MCLLFGLLPCRLHVLPRRCVLLPRPPLCDLGAACYCCLAWMMLRRHILALLSGRSPVLLFRILLLPGALGPLPFGYVIVDLLAPAASLPLGYGRSSLFFVGSTVCSAFEGWAQRAPSWFWRCRCSTPTLLLLPFPTPLGLGWRQLSFLFRRANCDDLGASSGSGRGESLRGWGFGVCVRPGVASLSVSWPAPPFCAGFRGGEPRAKALLGLLVLMSVTPRASFPPWSQHYRVSSTLDVSPGENPVQMGDGGIVVMTFLKASL